MRFLLLLEKVVQDCDVAGCAFRVDHDLSSPFSGLLSVACRVEVPCLCMCTTQVENSPSELVRQVFSSVNNRKTQEK